MKLEVGKTYKDLDGLTWKMIYEEDGGNWVAVSDESDLKWFNCLGCALANNDSTQILPRQIRKQGWVNITNSSGKNMSRIYSTFHAAIYNRATDLGTLDTINISWQEDE